MSKLCEICGMVEEDEIEETELKSDTVEISMRTLHICEKCIIDRQHSLL
ncbi:hypothetical protein [Cytobacillus horneckiae]